MHRRLIGLVLFLTAWMAGSGFAQTSDTYYLALGDSLALGVQPSLNGLVATNQGYADDLFAVFHSSAPNLQLVKLGCSGESSATMIDGGECIYSLGSQLQQAIDFVQTHRVALITLDIGADDVIPCATLAGIDQACVTAGLSSLAANLPVILNQLRSAAGKHVPIIAMNYYDPGLAAWTFPNGPELAKESLQFTHVLNRVLEQNYRLASVPAADVAAAFHINNWARVPFVGLPLNVLVTLAWTWMSVPPPLGPDIHPNAVGYGVIAGAFLNAILAP